MSYAVKDGDNWYQMSPPDAREGDECKVIYPYKDSPEWKPCTLCFGECDGGERRRLINPNADSEPGTWRICNLDERPLATMLGGAQFTMDGITWCNFINGANLSVEQLARKNAEKQEVKGQILAIRVRVEQEWPRYWQWESDNVCSLHRQDKDGSHHCWLNGEWVKQTQGEERFKYSEHAQCKPIPATYAERIMRGEEKTCATQTGNCVHCDKPIKDCECFSEQKPVPVESNAGQEICECGHSKRNHTSRGCDFGGFLISCSCECRQFKTKARPEPTPKEADVKGPQVYLTSRCIPNPRTRFWYLMEQETEWLLSTTIIETEHGVRQYVASIGAVKWMRCEPPYAIPPTPTASGDGFEEWWKVHGDAPVPISGWKDARPSGWKRPQQCQTQSPTV